ncbi:MAG: S8 family serine peptidase [Candidatus Zixiibacteriota bacterium]|nr:MAG: S8 family serine peptidase [candidate division Zixibacteria bacterium]
MKAHYALRLAVLIVLVLSASTIAYGDGRSASSQFDEDVCGLIVKVKSGVKISVSDEPGFRNITNVPELDRLNAKWGVTGVRKLILTGQGCESHPFERYYVLERIGGYDYAGMREEYEQLPSIEEAHFNFKVSLCGAPNDPLFPYQYNLYNTGQLHPAIVTIEGDNNDTLAWVSGLAGADINAYEAISNPPDDSRTAVVAVLDTGVDLDHPELAGRIWTNDLEIDGNGIDDDNNGYIDDVIGWHFIQERGSKPGGDNDPTDWLGHGTICAGVVASLTNNEQGIAGICPDVKIMALTSDPLDVGFTIAMILYATDNGADVISMSFVLGRKAANPPLIAAIEYAISKGVVLFAGAGNSGIEEYNIPASHDLVIAVGASNDLDQVADFSTYGQHLDLVAPGVDILSLRADDLDFYAITNEPEVHIIDDYYYVARGTSMSTPTAAGVAATLRVLSPGLDPAKTREILTSTARDLIDPYGDGSYLPGWDMYSGWGCVDMGAALNAAPSVRAHISSPVANEMFYTPSVEIVGTADGDDFQSYVLEYGEGFEPAEWFQIASSSSPVTDNVLGVWSTGSLGGIYTIRLRVGEFNFDVVTVQLDPQAAPVATKANASNEPVLHANYPNPFNPSTDIRFNLPYASHVKLEVFNIMGQKVSTLVDEYMLAGPHIVTFNGDNQASGMYLYRLTTDQSVIAKKMMLVK